MPTGNFTRQTKSYPLTTFTGLVTVGRCSPVTDYRIDKINKLYESPRVMCTYKANRIKMKIKEVSARCGLYLPQLQFSLRKNIYRYFFFFFNIYYIITIKYRVIVCCCKAHTSYTIVGTMQCTRRLDYASCEMRIS